MTKPNEKLEFPRQSARDILTDVLRDGAQQMLATAIEARLTTTSRVGAATLQRLLERSGLGPTIVPELEHPKNSAAV